MADGHEERQELEWRRKQEEQENRDDQLDRNQPSPWQPERKES